MTVERVTRENVVSLDCMVCLLERGLTNSAAKYQAERETAQGGYPIAYGWLRSVCEGIVSHPEQWSVCREHAKQRRVRRLVLDWDKGSPSLMKHYKRRAR